MKYDCEIRKPLAKYFSWAIKPHRDIYRYKCIQTYGENAEY